MPKDIPDMNENFTQYWDVSSEMAHCIIQSLGLAVNEVSIHDDNLQCTS